MLKNILEMLRIKHYIKNTIVFIPLIFSLNFGNIEKCTEALVAFAAFCAISSAVYIFNDLKDINQDKLHPKKKFRPIASGKISLPTAILSFILLVGISSALALSLNMYVLGIIWGYLVLNIYYTLRLKKVELVDVLCIALCFILRVLAGCEAIEVVASPLIILLTFFMSMFFTFMKRKLELQLQGENFCRSSLKNFTPEILNQFVVICAVLSISFYFTYVLDDKTIARGSELLYLSVIPFTMVLLRLIYLNFQKCDYDDPVYFIYKDNVTKAFLLLYFITLFAVL